MQERRKLERHHVSSSLEVYDLDSGQLLGRVVDLHAEGLMLLSETPLELNKAWALQVNLPMTLNGTREFILDAESRWNRESIGGTQYWTGLEFTRLPEESRQCIERMVSSR
jgi:hypothetical protein